MNRLLLLSGVVLAVCIGLLAAGRLGIGPVVITDEGEQKIILRFGEDRRVTEPGLGFRIPLIENARTYEKRILHLNTEAREIQTRDEERIVVDNYAIWWIEDPVKFLASFQAGGMPAAQQRIDRIVRAAVREVIGQHTWNEVLTEKRVEIMNQMTQQTDASLDSFGIGVRDVRINRTEVPGAAVPNVYARMQAERDRLARGHRAEGDEQARRIRAEADRDARVIVALAHRDAEITRGEGDAESTRIYGEAYSTAPDFYAFVRSLEAYRKTIDENTTLVLSPKAEFFQFFEGISPSGRSGSSPR